MSKIIVFVTTLVVPNFQLATMLHLTIIMCEDGDTIWMLTTLIDESKLVRTPHDVLRTPFNTYLINFGLYKCPKMQTHNLHH